jgi:hypothetical protein
LSALAAGEGNESMQILKRLYRVGLIAALALSGSLVLGAQDSPKQDVKDAGHETKEAAKDTGKTAKDTTKKTGHAVKKGTNKAAEKTEDGAKKVKAKTDPD